MLSACKISPDATKPQNNTNNPSRIRSEQIISNKISDNTPRYAENHTGCEAINLGTGHGASVLEVLHAYEQAVGRSLPYVIAPRRDGDIPEMCANAEKAKRLLHWEAHSDLLTMCRDSWNFTQKQQQ